VRRFALLLLLAVAVPAAPALAGGWATVELGAKPSGLEAGKPWNVELLVKAHGVTPMDDLTPSVRITNDEGVVKTFVAKPAGKPGTYVAAVTFPSEGTWQTRIFDGYADTTPHRLAPLEVAPAGQGTPASVFEPAPAPAVIADDDGAPWPQIVAVALAVLFFLGLWMALAWRPVSARVSRRADKGRYLPTS
jgi:hypothetical protein